MPKDPLIKKIKTTATQISHNVTTPESLEQVLREQTQKEGILDRVLSYEITVDITCTLNKKTKAKKKIRLKGKTIPLPPVAEYSTLAKWVLQTNGKSGR